MVELAASNPGIKVRPLAREAARQLGLKGEPRDHEERLRKKYAALKEAGNLPVLESGLDFRRRKIREAYVVRGAWEAGLREQLAAQELEAAALGLNVRKKDLSGVLLNLEHEKENCELYLHGPADIAIDTAFSKGLSSDEAESEFVALAKRYEQVKKEVEVVRALCHLRRALRVDQAVSTQQEDEIG
jgi:hypothetical protein